VKWRRIEAGFYQARGATGAWSAYHERSKWRLVGCMESGRNWIASFGTLRAAQQQAEEWETQK
jgi:hypothetical protein